MRLTERRPGFTFVEIMMVAVLGGLVLAATYKTLVVQEQAFRNQSAVVQTQQTTRVALEVLASEIRQISARGGDLIAASPDSMTFRALRTIGFVCETDILNEAIAVFEPADLFQAKDSLLVFVDGDTLTGDDDSWRISELKKIDVSLCGADLKQTAMFGTTNTRLFYLQSGAIPLDSVERGSPVRAFDQFTYRLRLDDTEQHWMLSRNHSKKKAIPIVGPLASSAAKGVRFVYFDAAGDPITPVDAATRAQVARVAIHIKGESRARGGGRMEYGDSLATLLYLRN